MKEGFGMTYIYPDELFYKTHKISQKHFLLKLHGLRKENKKEQVSKLISTLCDDESHQGRRGVLSMTQVKSIVKKQE